jgi:hypothetical protein
VQCFFEKVVVGNVGGGAIDKDDEYASRLACVWDLEGQFDQGCRYPPRMKLHVRSVVQIFKLSLVKGVVFNAVMNAVWPAENLLVLSGVSIAIE